MLHRRQVVALEFAPAGRALARVVSAWAALALAALASVALD
jgi:hypothetical protein